MKKLFYERRFIFIPIGIAAMLALISYVVMQLWNILLPDILHVTTITYWQAMGIFILCKILFGFGPKRGGGRPQWMGRRGAMEERLNNMSAEERQRFREQMKNRWNCGRKDWRKAWADEENRAEDEPKA